MPSSRLTPAALAERLHPLAVSAAQTAIERAGLQASDIDWVLPAGFSDSFTLGVSRELGIAQARHSARLHPGRRARTRTA